MSIAQQIVPAPAVDRVEHTPAVGVKWHPFADIFPWIDGPAFQELKADIGKNGVLEPIVFLGEYVLDGRNRYLAARELGIEYPRVEYVGDDPLGFVISRNLARRHLDTSQRAMAAKRIANARQGERRDLPANEGRLVTQAEAAAALNVSVASVERAAVVVDKGAPELVAAVDAGKVTVSAAADIAVLPVEQQIKALADSDPKAFRRVMKDTRAVGQAEKKAKRAEREVVLAGKIKALPDRKYGVILADPEWQDENWSEETGSDRSASNHYPVSSAAVIASRPVVSIAADDCVLGLWTTNQHLRIALDILEAWGFAYVSNYVWGKDKIGLGRWNRSKHEILLIGTRGSPVAPAPGTQWESLQIAPRGEHSAKPELFLEMIEAYYPNTPKIELNRRGPARPGWDAWGAETDPDHAEPTSMVTA